MVALNGFGGDFGLAFNFFCINGFTFDIPGTAFLSLSHSPSRIRTYSENVIMVKYLHQSSIKKETRPSRITDGGGSPGLTSEVPELFDF